MGAPMRITSKGQVTIPVEIRERTGLLPNTEVVFEYDGEVVRLRKAKGKNPRGRGAKVDAHIRRTKKRADIKMTTEELMALLREP